jgi:hypothetical protein
VHNAHTMPRIDPGDRPELHRAAVRIATRIAFLLHPALRSGEHQDAERCIYVLCREELDAMDARPPTAA